MKKVLMLLIIFVSDALADNDFRYEDKIRISEAVKIVDHCKEVWTGWNIINIAILLVTDDNEYLVNHILPTPDFKFIYFDTILASNIYKRPRVFGKNLLATFPAVNGVSTIVIGTPENTNKNSREWVLILIHEHFHQLQFESENYLSGVDSLDLAGDDKTGMWMLNYKFPYDDQVISDQYKKLILAAKTAVLYLNTVSFNYLFEKYLSERKMFRSLLKDNDYKYFSFQIWQEGIAKYTEIKVSECIQHDYQHSEAFTNLKDVDLSDSFYSNIFPLQLRRADEQDLSSDKRNCFYTLGSLEGLLADAVNPQWKNQYFSEMFFIEKYYK
ncbi:MAG: hypothetical protein ABIY50_01680 [Ignavibacteria bacterium]